MNAISSPLRVPIPALCLAATLAGCVGQPPPSLYREPEIVPVTRTQTGLQTLPAPASTVPVAVYEFEDKTGQFQPKETVQTLSRAVTQGGTALLNKALRDAGNGAWFTVLERNGLDNLLKERQIIRDMRLRYLGERQVNPNALPPLLFAGVILEGGIVGFDTNTLTGGLGARFLGIGGNVEYRQNTVTVNLRAVSVKTGEILANVTTSKTVASVGGQGGTFKFVSFDALLEIEAGVTNNEPVTMAVRRAIEKAVYNLIIEGSEAELWSFADQGEAARLLAQYRAEQEGLVKYLAAEAPKPAETAPADEAQTSRAPASQKIERTAALREAPGETTAETEALADHGASDPVPADAVLAFFTEAPEGDDLSTTYRRRYGANTRRGGGNDR